MTTQRNGSNGTAKENGQSNGKANTTLTAVVKPEEKKNLPAVIKKDADDLPPLEDRILKVQQLSDLTAKREKLLGSLKKLKSFKTSSENRNLSVTISDLGEEWETFNTDAIKACIETMAATIQKKLDEVEAQIKF